LYLEHEWHYTYAATANVPTDDILRLELDLGATEQGGWIMHACMWESGIAGTLA
jgi:hypothetical protein